MVFVFTGFRRIFPLFSRAFEARRFCNYDLPYSEKSINHVTLLGRVGSEPQLRGSEQRPVLLFSLATNIHFKKIGSEMEHKTEWHRISIFKPHLRDVCQSYLRKGNRVLVQGKIVYGEIVDSNGVSRSTTTIAADELIFLGGNKDNTVEQ